MPENETWTLGRLLQWTTDFLGQHQSESPRLDAEVLLAHAVGCERIGLYTRWHEVADDQVRSAYRELVGRRAAGCPVAYLVGHREFYSLDFVVTPDVLIPRPETELLVLETLERIKQFQDIQPDRVWRVADVGTGSGAIGIAVAARCPQVEVVAVDISPAALAVARSNAEGHGVAERVEFVESNLLAAVPAMAEFDFVLSNPPYVAATEWNDLAAVVRDHEPRVALVPGPRGDELMEPLIAQAADRLKRGGILMFELSPQLAERGLELVRQNGRFQEPQIRKDLAGFARVVRAELLADDAGN